jgi:glycogen operon protein
MSRGEFARRFLASADVFHRRDRKPTASVNYLCAHDGFTLWDAVSYNHKHNEANGESNQDGRAGEIAFNHGVEGETLADGTVQERKQKARVLLATTLLAQGTPMLRAGDEILQTQRGNNNAYCQDNEISWIDWQAGDQSMRAFASRLIALRKRHAVLMHNAWFLASPSGHAASVQWFTPHGHALSTHEWEQSQAQAFAALFTPAAQVLGARVWLGFNPERHAITFNLPDGAWQLAIDCARPTEEGVIYQNSITLDESNIVVLLHKNQ